MRDVLRRLGLQAKDETEYTQMNRLQLHLRNLMQRKTKLVLIFDEVQALSYEAIEQVRLLSNLRSTNMNLLEVVLAGQPELEDTLQRPEMEALRQRISVVARIRRFGDKDVDPLYPSASAGRRPQRDAVRHDRRQRGHAYFTRNPQEHQSPLL